MPDDHQWYMNAIFYEVYVRAFYDSNGDGDGDLAGLRLKLDYLKELGVDCLWLLPFYHSPLKDDGYDISDYYQILAEYGTIEDLQALIAAAHQRGIRVVTDLVMNHTSDQHPWFQAARLDRQSSYRDFYVWSDTDQKYRDARIIFLDTEASNWTWDELAGQYFWHRFFASQPDLNFDNPRVQRAILDVVKFWLDLGVDGFRADAVPYLFEREGTSCENLPETHAFLKEVRRYVDENYPGRVLLCEANQWPEDVLPYFGQGDEFHLAFHFPLMPRLFMALRQQDAGQVRWILDRTPPLPDGCQWCTFLRNHDELTLEMVTEAERQWMWEQYAPEARMRLNQGIRRRLASLLDHDQALIELAFSLLFSLPGAPVIYYGDEIGMGDNIWLDDRNGVRTPMQWDGSPSVGFSTAQAPDWYAPPVSAAGYSPEQVNVAAQRAHPDSLWHRVRRMIVVRKELPVLGWGSLSWIETSSPAVAAYWRGIEGQRLLVVNNFSRTEQEFTLPFPETPVRLEDLLGGRQVSLTGGNELNITLGPCQYLWLKVDLPR